ncbi:MAG TPA: SDR family NAD(P)-dependent oxidoreductase [Gemmatimonadaceae bacterium]|nr:SDR family NAD(P)-dependent oxidoreductase [Gemmatimonadaceae bacterium]
MNRDSTAIGQADARSGRVAVVAGATRGAGRGIARMLGAAGATVYCTGRSSRVQANLSDHVNAGRPETIEETAEMVTADGGTGIPVRVDHTVEGQVSALFERIGREQGRLDVLAIAMTGQPASWKNFLEETPAEGKTFVEGWIWPHVMTAWHGAKLMVQQPGGLIVELVEQDNVGYHGAFYFDMMETLLKRFVLGLANDLGKARLTAVAVAPGFMRTEAILQQFGVTEANWRTALGNPQAAAMGWGGSETPCFVGRAVAALAADSNVARKNGGIYTTRALSEEYGFNDVDGNRPDYAVFDAAIAQAKKTFLAPMLDAGRFTEVDWKLASKLEMRS